MHRFSIPIITPRSSVPRFSELLHALLCSDLSNDLGKLNPFEEVYLAPISYVAQAVVELLNFLVLIFGLYVFAGKAKNHKGHCKANVALWCLGMVICSPRCFLLCTFWLPIRQCYQ